MEETLTRDEKAQYQGAIYDKNVAELLDMTDEMNKRPESNEGSKDLPSGLNNGSQQTHPPQYPCQPGDQKGAVL